MKAIFQNLASASQEGMDGYRREYLNHIQEIFSLVCSPTLLKSQIKTNTLENAESLLRFSLVFNDLSLLSCSGGKDLSVILLEPKWFRDHFGVESSILVPQSQMEKYGIDPNNPIVSPGLVFPMGDEFDQLIEKLHPFIANRRLLIQPNRTVFVATREPNHDGNREWQGIDVSPFTPLEQWEMLEEANSRPISLSYQTNDHLDHDALFEITIPYFEGVQFGDLAKIIEDEFVLISGLRSSIKIAMETCGKDAKPREVVKDVIEPKVDSINRKFKSIINTQSFKVAGAAVSTVVLAYTAVASSGMASAIATICGTGGLGLLGNEYSTYKEKIDSLRDDPHYFLWRCKKISKSP